MHRVTAFLRDFIRRTDGSMTILGLYFFLFMAAISAIALDTMNIYTQRTHLQVAADSGAHAALYTRNANRASASEAKTLALAIIDATMPSSVYGEVSTSEEIDFGIYDAETDTFTVDDSSSSHVRVVTSMRGTNGGGGNSLGTYLFKLVGIDSFDLQTEAIFSSEMPGCLREGFVSQTRTDIQSNNSFSNEFCVHSNGHVEINNGNTFAEGTTISMPNIDEFVIPGYENNPGAEDALRVGTMRLDLLDQIQLTHTAYLNPPSDGSFSTSVMELPDYIDSLEVKTFNSRTLVPGDLEPGHIYNLSCPGKKVTLGGTVVFSDAEKEAAELAGETLEDLVIEDVVIVTDCEIVISMGTVLHDVRIITTDASDRSVTSASNVVLGKDDDCAEGGGVEIYTMGGMDFASGLNMYGSQIAAKKDINFSAQADGVKGASLIAGGEIDGTANGNMGLCLNGGSPRGMDDFYFQLVR